MMRHLRHLSIVVLSLPTALLAQQWTPGDDVPLVRQAVLQRSSRDADTVLASWHATAHGFVRMSSIIDQGQGPTERLMKMDELKVEVYGEIPSRSKQVITFWRDTSYLPNRINYHRDHLGIVANDFGGAIRLGDGQEVRNLIHPLSPEGLNHYLFSLGSLTTLQGPQGTIHVRSVEVRPRDPASAGTVGTLFLDVDRGSLVQFRFTFTPASYIDRTVRDITVVLENALLERARWLPWRQSIVIRRENSGLELPMHTVLRADWELDDYALGVTHPPEFFVGPSVVGPRVAPRSPPGLEALTPQVARLPSSEFDVDAIQAMASAMLNGRLLNGLPLVRTSLEGYGELLQVNRVGGITAAYGLRFPVGPKFTGRVAAGFGFGDSRILARGEVEGRLGAGNWMISGRRWLNDLSDEPVTSRMANSFSTALSGDDHGDWTLLEGGKVAIALPVGRRFLGLAVQHEYSTSVTTTFSPLHGESRPNPALGIGKATLVRANISGGGPMNFEWQAALEGGHAASDWLRASGTLRWQKGALQIAAQGGAGSLGLPGYRTFALGGTGTLPGLAFRSIGGRRYAAGEISYALPVGIPLPAIRGLPYAGFLRQVVLPSSLAPFVGMGAAWGDRPDLPWRGKGVSEPVVGARLDLWGALLRLEGGVSVRHGTWGLSLDLHPDWWPIF